MPLSRLLLATMMSAVWIVVVTSLLGGGAMGAVLGLGGIYAILWWAIMRRHTTPACSTKIKPPAVAAMAHKGERIFLFTCEGFARAFAAANGSTTIWKQGEKKPA
jgi:hypothetical protein